MSSMTRFVTHTTNSPMSDTKLNKYSTESPNTKQSDILSLIIATASLRRFLVEKKSVDCVYPKKASERRLKATPPTRAWLRSASHANSTSLQVHRLFISGFGKNDRRISSCCL